MDKTLPENIVQLKVIMPKLTEDDLWHNEMVCKVLMLVAGILLEHRPKSKEELYLVSIYEVLSKILSCYQSINRACYFIKRCPTTKQLDRNDEMTMIDYYCYHYDVVIHKFSTIRDLSYKLINRVFNLGLVDRDCNWNGISKKRDLITIPGVFNIQTLFYHLLEEMELARNGSTHNADLKIKEFDKFEISVTLSQWKRKYPDYFDFDPMPKGSYEEYLLKSSKIEFLERINNYKMMSLFCIQVLTCCMSNKLISELSDSLKGKYNETLKKAEQNINAYERKYNKISDFKWYLRSNDDVMEYLLSNDKEKDKGKKKIVQLLVSFVSHNNM